MGQYPIPPVILARLAVDLDYQGKDLGFSLLQNAIRRTLAIAEQAGIRALLTHPIDADAEAFYRRFGFESTPENERQLICCSRMRGVLLGHRKGRKPRQHWRSGQKKTQPIRVGFLVNGGAGGN